MEDAEILIVYFYNANKVERLFYECENHTYV